MRRKTSASTLARRSGAPRSLCPASRRGAAFLPTAASLAVALASFGCSTPTLDAIVADPVKNTVSAPPAPSPTPSAVPYLDPDPHELDGDVVSVKPTPVAPVSSVKKK
jgi:hypothetical protein